MDSSNKYLSTFESRIIIAFVILLILLAWFTSSMAGARYWGYCDSTSACASWILNHLWR